MDERKGDIENHHRRSESLPKRQQLPRRKNIKGTGTGLYGCCSIDGYICFEQKNLLMAPYKISMRGRTLY